jgi:hypothetical protein
VPTNPIALALMYFVLPLWLAAGVADWLCHRAAQIEKTAGPKESLIHLLGFAVVGVPLLAALFLEINALVLAVMIVAFFAHEAIVLWDLSYAASARTVTPVEQQVHSFVELVPLMGIVGVATLHWDQFAALFGFGMEAPRFELRWKPEPLPFAYSGLVLVAATIFGVIPFVEELVRGVRSRDRTGQTVR